MHIWGLHAADVAIVFLYIVVVLWLGKRAAEHDPLFLGRFPELRAGELAVLVQLGWRTAEEGRSRALTGWRSAKGGWLRASKHCARSCRKVSRDARA